MKYTLVIAAAMFVLGAITGNSMNTTARGTPMVSPQPTAALDLDVKTVGLKHTNVD